jgi:cystathionine beta-lyase
VITSNAEYRAALTAAAAASGVGSKNRFGITAATAAYQGGAPWLDALIPYLQTNRDILANGVAERVPGVRAMHLESTYLGWLDFTALGLDPSDLLKKVQREAGIAVNAGPSFGKGGAGWLRFNFACRRAMVEDCVDRLADVFAS